LLVELAVQEPAAKALTASVEVLAEPLVEVVEALVVSVVLDRP
jgi:hypothetical protein